MVPKESKYLQGTNGVFNPADEHNTFILSLTPLLDRTHTPRGALRAITLDRHHTNKRWLASKTICEELSPERSKKEIAKGKLLRKITKKEDKAK